MSCWQGVTGEWPCFPPTRPNRRRARDRQDFLIRSCSRPCGYGLTPWRAWAGSRPSDFRGRPLVFGRMFCKCSAHWSPKPGGGHGGARFDRGVRGGGGPAGRRAGACRLRHRRLQHRRPRRQGGPRVAGAGALGADRLGPGAAGQAHHRQSRARRHAQGGQPLRPADRARRHGGDRRHSRRCARRLCGDRRTGARRRDQRRRRRAAGGDRRQRGGARA